MVTATSTSAELPAFEEIAETFEILQEWDDRYRFMIDLGRRLPGLPDDLKTEDNQVRGCQSTVWLIANRNSGSPDSLTFQGESDSAIVTGLIAILFTLYSGRTSEEILAVDAHDILTPLGLDHHLSPSRRNGLAAMIERIRKFAFDARIEG